MLTEKEVEFYVGPTNWDPRFKAYFDRNKNGKGLMSSNKMNEYGRQRTLGENKKASVGTVKKYLQTLEECMVPFKTTTMGLENFSSPKYAEGLVLKAEIVNALPQASLDTNLQTWFKCLGAEETTLINTNTIVELDERYEYGLNRYEVTKTMRDHATTLPTQISNTCGVVAANVCAIWGKQTGKETEEEKKKAMCYAVSAQAADLAAKNADHWRTNAEPWKFYNFIGSFELERLTKFLKGSGKGWRKDMGPVVTYPRCVFLLQVTADLIARRKVTRMCVVNTSDVGGGGQHYVAVKYSIEVDAEGPSATEEVRPTTIKVLSETLTNLGKDPVAQWSAKDKEDRKKSNNMPPNAECIGVNGSPVKKKDGLGEDSEMHESGSGTTPAPASAPKSAPAPVHKPETGPEHVSEAGPGPGSGQVHDSGTEYEPEPAQLPVPGPPNTPLQGAKENSRENERAFKLIRQNRTQSDVRKEAVQSGIKKKGVGWKKSCPPNGDKTDIIRHLWTKKKQTGTEAEADGTRQKKEGPRKSTRVTYEPNWYKAEPSGQHNADRKTGQEQPCPKTT